MRIYYFCWGKNNSLFLETRSFFVSLTGLELTISPRWLYHELHCLWTSQTHVSELHNIMWVIENCSWAGQARVCWFHRRHSSFLEDVLKSSSWSVMTSVDHALIVYKHKYNQRWILVPWGGLEWTRGLLALFLNSLNVWACLYRLKTAGLLCKPTVCVL